jgi:16S rRNA (guanine527-N7)-methyltransferase
VTLVDTLADLGLPPTCEAPLRDFVTLFLKWNLRINLSAARSERDLQDHVVDCLHLVPHLLALAGSPPSAPPSFLDVGSGGGLPAVIVAICVPDSHITALEPIHKKHAFLRTAARELALPGLEPRAERLDEHDRSDYDAAMSRATFDLGDWLQLGVARVKPAGIAFGFEAVPRSDLPPAALRYPYLYAGRRRAIVALRRQLEAPPREPLDL